MDWTQVLTIVGSNIVLAIMGLGTTITLFLWARSEAREDQQQIKLDQQQIREEFNEMRAEFREFRTIMLEETKSFHARLCEIEAKRGK